MKYVRRKKTRSLLRATSSKTKPEETQIQKAEVTSSVKNRTRAAMNCTELTDSKQVRCVHCLIVFVFGFVLSFIGFFLLYFALVVFHFSLSLLLVEILHLKINYCFLVMLHH